MIVDMVPGKSYDLVSSQEMHGHVQGIRAQMQEFIRAEALGVKPIRFSGTVNVGAAGAFNCVSKSSPNEGYVWTMVRLNVLDSNLKLAAGYLARCAAAQDLTPLTGPGSIPSENLRYLLDTIKTPAGSNGEGVNLYSKGAMLFGAGEIPIVTGWVAGATTVTMNGNCIEVPAEMVAKLLL